MSKRKPAGMPEDTSPAAKKLHMDVMRVMEAAKAAISYSSLSSKVGAASMDDSQAMPPPPARAKKSAPKPALDFEIKKELQKLGFVHKDIRNMAHMQGSDSKKLANIYRVMDILTEEGNLKILKELRGEEIGLEASQISNILNHAYNKIESLGRCVNHIKALIKAGVPLITIERGLLAHRPETKGGFEAPMQKLYVEKGLPSPELHTFVEPQKPTLDFVIKKELQKLGFVHKNIKNMAHMQGSDSKKLAKIYRVMDILTEEGNLKILKELRGEEIGLKASQISNILNHAYNKIESLGRCVNHIKALKKAGVPLITIERELLAHRPEIKGGFEAAIKKLYASQGLPSPEFAESEDSEGSSSSSISVARKKTKSKAKSSKTKLTKKQQKSLETDDDETEEEDSEATEDDDYQDSSSAAASSTATSCSDDDSEDDSDNATYLAQKQFDPSLLSHEMESSSSEDLQGNDPIFFAGATPFLSVASQTPRHSSSSSSSSWMAATPLSSVVSQTPMHMSKTSDDEVEDNDPDHELNYASFEPVQSTDMMGDAYS